LDQSATAVAVARSQATGIRVRAQALGAVGIRELGMGRKTDV
jgi:hypothetical protein